ncbi:MAG: hypothetical protein WCL43_08635 [Chlorobium sp.]|jgi:ABC-type molybdate transport system substrate-binding protein|nr:MAG: hypothetical protein FDX12_00315 [Chlorobium sp.]
MLHYVPKFSMVGIIILLIVIIISLGGSAYAQNTIVATTKINVTVTDSFLQYLNQLRSQANTTIQPANSTSTVPRDTTSVFVP